RPVVSGRARDPPAAGPSYRMQDDRGSPLVAMVNEAFTHRYFANASVLGHRFGFGGAHQGQAFEIIGVLKDARFHDAKDEAQPIAFITLLQDTTQFALSAEVEMRTAGDPAAAANVLRQTIADVDRNLPINDPRPLRDQVASTFDT